jgi:UDP-N-acetylmuramate dehydrogenase
MLFSSASALIDRLPPVRGRLIPRAPLAGLTWFRVGGPAEVLFRPADVPDLVGFLAGCPEDVPLTVIGVGSNLLVRDGGVPGVVIRLGGAFGRIVVAEEGVICAGAGALDSTVARVCQEAGLAGLEFLSGIPGTIGGALRMNAGAYGREMKDVVVDVRALDHRGKERRFDLAGLDFGYRRCGVPAGTIFIEARMRGEAGQAEEIAARMEKISQARAETQPIHARTGGSTFANPPGVRAWQLIDQAGCRGLVRGGAQVSEKHCNFLVNTGQATAEDVEELGEEVRRRVRETSGIVLEWEIRRIGVGLPGQKQVEADGVRFFNPSFLSDGFSEGG